MNISPEEIDQLLGGHPKLVDACAFPIPDPVMGERIGLAIVPKPGEEVTLEAVAGYLKSLGVAVFKMPEKLYQIGPLPRNALNKILRYEVRERALACQEGPD
jgi:acyl-CoA synthetase (AMP-forming)/AMP-acid ligase II